MKHMHKLWSFLILAVLSSGSLWSGQQSPSSVSSSPGDRSEQPFKVTVDVNVVNVPVTVRRKEGGFIKGLPKEAFRIYEDGVLQEDISLFAQEKLPTHLAIVLDISGSVNTAWGTIMHATRRFVEHLHSDDRFSLYTFNTQIRLKMDWGNKTDKMEEVLGSIFCTGNTKVWDTVWAISRGAFKGIKEKKAVIIMSDGMDNRSSKSYNEAVEAAVRSEAIIYIVSKTEALRQMYLYHKRKTGDPYNYFNPEDFAMADFALRGLAEKTGGRVLYPNSFGQLDDIYEEVIDELRNQYTLGYISNNPINDGAYRNIEVRVDAPDAVVRARPGYYAPRD